MYILLSELSNLQFRIIRKAPLIVIVVLIFLQTEREKLRLWSGPEPESQNIAPSMLTGCATEARSTLALPARTL